MKHLAQQCGEWPSLTMLTDASAAQALCSRQGAGRVKHLTVRQLWVQEKEAMGELGIKKAPRELNAADMLTHHYSRQEGEKIMSNISFRRIESASDTIRGGVTKQRPSTGTIMTVLQSDQEGLDAWSGTYNNHYPKHRASS